MTREVGTFVILDVDRRRDRGRRPDRPGRPERRRQDDAAPARGRAATSRTAARSIASAGCRSGCSPRRRTSTRRSWPRPTCGTAVRTGAAHLDRMAAELAAYRARRAASPTRATPTLQHEFEVLGGYTLDQRVDAALQRPRLQPRRMGEAAVGAVGRRADPGVARPARHRRPGPAAARRADEPPRPRRARMARGAPPAPRRGAARRVARPGVPRCDRDPDLGAARPPADGVPRRLQRLPPPARGTRRPAVEGRRDAGRGDRPRAGARPALPEPPQVQQDARARGAPRAPPGRPSRGPAERPQAGPAAAALVGRRPVALGRDRRSASRTWPSATCPGAGADGGGRAPATEPRDRGPRSVPRRPARRADRHRRTERRRQDDAPAHDRRRPAAARRFGRRSGTPSSSATSPSCAARRSRARPSSTRSSRRSRSRPGRRAATSPGSCSVATTSSRRCARCRAASGRGSSSRCSGIQPSNLLLLDEPTNHLDIPAREAIEAFMGESPATLLVVSPRPATARDGVREAVGRRRRVGRAVRRWLSRMAGGGGRRLDDRGGRSSRRRSGCAPAGEPVAGRARRRRAPAATTGPRAARPSKAARSPDPRRTGTSCRRTPIGARRPRSTPS